MVFDFGVGFSLGVGFGFGFGLAFGYRVIFQGHLVYLSAQCILIVAIYITMLVFPTAACSSLKAKR
jgi:hypothetical protein